MSIFTRGNLPPVDLLIRTSGEQRISTFYCGRLHMPNCTSQVLWPDFDEEHLKDAMLSYQKRERRFGKTSEQIAKL